MTNKEYVEQMHNLPNPIPEGYQTYQGVLVHQVYYLTWDSDTSQPTSNKLIPGVNSFFTILPDGRCFMTWGDLHIKIERKDFMIYPK